MRLSSLSVLETQFSKGTLNRFGFKLMLTHKRALISNHAILSLSSLTKHRASDHVCMITFNSALSSIDELLPLHSLEHEQSVL